MSIGFWAGIALGAGVVYWGFASSSGAAALLDAHGLVVVFGGTCAAMLVHCPVSEIVRALRSQFSFLAPGNTPAPEAAIEACLDLARRSQRGGGLLSLRGAGGGVANGFLERALTVAIATSEVAQARRTMEVAIRQIRVRRMEDSNFFRTMAVLAPMFGILGTLLGMIQVLASLQDPTKVGPAMALALSSAFLGIAFANFVCVPIAGRLRSGAIQETLVLQILLEGVLEIASGKPPYLVQIHLDSFVERRREEAGGEAGAAGTAAAAPR